LNLQIQKDDIKPASTTKNIVNIDDDVKHNSKSIRLSYTTFTRSNERLKNGCIKGDIGMIRDAIQVSASYN
jgi:hypothetical protein